MTSRRSGAFPSIVALLALSIFLSPSATAVGAVPSAVDESDKAFDDALRVRTLLGMRSDADYIVDSLSSPKQFPEDPLAVPMTVEEAEEVTRCLEIQDGIDPVAIWAETNLDGYAGMFMDQADGGQPVFLVKAGADVDPLLSKIPREMDFRVLEVTHSLAELLELQSQIANERGDLVRAGTPLVSVGIVPSRNALVIGLEKASISFADQSALRDRFGSAVIVEATSAGTDDACFSSGCMPTRGGIGMVSTAKGNTCTVGFSVKIFQHPTLSTPRQGLLTSGHCFRVDGDSGYGVEWRHVVSDSSTRVGYAYEETFTSNGGADAGVMTAHNTPATKNLLVWRTTGETRQVTSYAENAAQNEGDLVCRIGRTSNRTCGGITEINRTRWSTVSGYTRTLLHQNVVGFDSLGGDSGGPYYMAVGTAYARAYGIHIHSLDPEDREGWFSTWGWSQVQLSQEWAVVIGLCVTAAC